jgi:putative flippase GtrA
MTLAANPPQASPSTSPNVRFGMAALARHFPPGQFGRYLLVGGFNTLFGYGTYALLTALFDRVSPHGYILAGAVSTLLNITVSYLNYKWFVFKTKGNYLREWARCVAVYSGGIVIGIVALPTLVFAIRHYTSYFASAPYIAGAILTGATVVISFVGHKKFSFRPPK